MEGYYYHNGREVHSGDIVYDASHNYIGCVIGFHKDGLVSVEFEEADEETGEIEIVWSEIRDPKKDIFKKSFIEAENFDKAMENAKLEHSYNEKIKVLDEVFGAIFNK